MGDEIITNRSALNRRMVQAVVQAAADDQASEEIVLRNLGALLDARDRVLDERDETIGMLELLINRQMLDLRDAETYLQRLAGDARSMYDSIIERRNEFLREIRERSLGGA